MAQSSHLGRGGFPPRPSERVVPSSSQAQFGQSAPGFDRQPQYSRQPQQPTGNAYSQYTAGTGYGATRGQIQPPNGGITLGMERDGNAINLSDEQRDEINDAFQIFDLDKDGALDVHELRVAFRALGFDLNKLEVGQLMTANGVPKPNAQMIGVGRRGNNSYHPSQMIIARDQFFRLAAQKMDERDPRDEVERAFSLFDQEGKGHIDFADLKRISGDLGETDLNEQELMTMIEEFDYDGVGGISKEAFFGICLQ